MTVSSRSASDRLRGYYQMIAEEDLNSVYIATVQLYTLLRGESGIM